MAFTDITMSCLIKKILHSVKDCAVDFALTLWSVFDWRNDGYSCAEDTGKNKRLWYILLGTAVVLGAALRLYVFAFEPDLGRDAFDYIFYAEKWANEGFEAMRRSRETFFIPPCGIWWMKIFIQMGASPLAASVAVNMVFGILPIPLFYGMVNRLFDSRKAGVTAAFLAAVNPVLIDYSTNVMRENFMIAGMAAMLYFCVLGFRRSSWYFCGSGFFAAFSIMSRHEALEIIPLMTVCFLLFGILRVFPWKKLLRQLLCFTAGWIAGFIILTIVFGVPADYYGISVWRFKQVLRWKL